MKAPRYILKKTHLEHCQQEEYINHLKKLDEIKKAKFQVKDKVEESNRLTNIRKKLIEIDQNRKDIELYRQQELQNMVLVNKLIDINKRELWFQRVKRSKTLNLKEIHNISQNKSCDYSFTTLEENKIIVDRLEQLPPIIKKRQQDQEYKEHRERVKMLEKFHKMKKKKGFKSISKLDQNNNHVEALSEIKQQDLNLVNQVQDQ